MIVCAIPVSLIFLIDVKKCKLKLRIFMGLIFFFDFEALLS